MTRNYPITCPSCQGTGSDLFAAPVAKCKPCGGTGVVQCTEVLPDPPAPGISPGCPPYQPLHPGTAPYVGDVWPPLHPTTCTAKPGGPQ